MSEKLRDRLTVFRDRSLYHRTGVVLVPRLTETAVERVLAALPGARRDFPDLIAANLRPDQRFVHLDRTRVLSYLREIAAAPPAVGVGTAVVGVECAVARWPEEAEAFWADFAELQRNPAQAVLAVVPEREGSVLPGAATLGRLRDDGRLLYLDEMGEVRSS